MFGQVETLKSSSMVINQGDVGELEISDSVVKNWNIQVVNTIGDTVFCEVDGSFFSMELTDYNKIK